MPLADPTPHPELAPKADLPNIPDMWPGAWGAYKYSRQAVKRNPLPILAVLVLYFLASGLPSILLNRSGRPWGNAIGDLISIPFSIALVIAYLASVRGQKISVGSALKASFDPMLILKYIANAILLTVAVVASAALLIVPFFFVMPRLVLAPYFLIDRKLSPLQALTVSWNATKGSAGKVWGIVGAAIAMSLIMLTFIGIPFALYLLFMYGASQALLYEFLNRAQPATADAAIAPAPADPVDQPQTPPSPPSAPAA